MLLSPESFSFIRLRGDDVFTFDNDTFEIHLTRGDTLTLDFQFEGDVPVGQDQLYFTVKKSVNDKSFKMEKKATLYGEDLARISIRSEDTRDLPFGKYFWDLRIFYSDGEIVTPMDPAPFYVDEVVGNDR